MSAEDVAWLGTGLRLALITRGAIRAVNDAQLGVVQSTRPSKIKWWTGELERMRRIVRRLRSRVQRARQFDSDDLARRQTDYRATLRTYKDLLVRAKMTTGGD